MSVLEEIVAKKRADVAARRAATLLDALADRTLRSERRFDRAIARPGLSLIAEIKRRSPSKGVLREDFDPGEIAAGYDPSARAISVLADEPYFFGALSHLTEARQRTRRPVLCKDFVVDPEYQITEARTFGADAALLLGRVLTPAQIELGLARARALGMAAIVEIHEEAELDRVLGETSADIIGVNSRDLHTLTLHPDRIFLLAPRIRAAGKLVVAESGLETREAIDRLRDVADAVLIGTSLMRSNDVAGALATLGFPPEPSTPEIKICGVRTRETAERCVLLDVDYVGFNFVPSSRRYVTPQKAGELWRGLSGPAVAGVFVDPTAAEIEAAACALPLEIVQLHGTESPELCAKLRRRFRVIKAISVSSASSLREIATYRAAGAEILFDAPVAGSGAPFDWSLLADDGAYFLAGGLKPENVAEAIARLHPAALDTASGVERDGVQDVDRITAFCLAVREATR